MRLISVLALNPARWSPHGEATVPRYSRSSVTGRVTSLIVRSPVSLYSPSPASSTLVERKVMVGYFSTSKKSALRRCSSRPASPLLTPATSMTATTDDSSGFSAIVTVPLVTREPAADLGHHQVAGGERHVGVRGVERPGAGGRQGGLGGLYGLRQLPWCAPRVIVHCNSCELNGCATQVSSRLLRDASRFLSGGTIRAWRSEARHGGALAHGARDAGLAGPDQVTTGVLGALDGELQAEHGLSLGEYEVLVHLSEEPDHSLRMTDLAGPAPPLAERHHPPDRRPGARRPRRAPAVSVRPPGIERGAHRRGLAPARGGRAHPRARRARALHRPAERAEIANLAAALVERRASIATRPPAAATKRSGD